MTTNAHAIAQRNKVRIRAIALPMEHGSWSFLLEPLIAGLALACSFSAIWIALLAIGAFFARQPLKILISDLRAGRNLPQTSFALYFTALFAAIALIGLTGSLYFTKPENLLPFLFVLPLAIYQIYCDATRNSRGLIPELSGAIAISSSSAAIAMAGGWAPLPAIALWGILAARLITSIIYVRNRLRLEKGKAFSRLSPIGLHLAAFLFIFALAPYGLSSIPVVLMFGVLTARAAWGLSPYRRKVKAVKIGIGEVAYGALTILSIIIGHYWNGI